MFTNIQISPMEALAREGKAEAEFVLGRVVGGDEGMYDAVDVMAAYQGYRPDDHMRLAMLAYALRHGSVDRIALDRLICSGIIDAGSRNVESW